MSLSVMLASLVGYNVLVYRQPLSVFEVGVVGALQE
jgi:hypothetical protein